MRRRTVGIVVFAAMCSFGWGLPVSAQASSSPPSEVQTEPAEPIPGGAKLKGKLNPGGLPTSYYFEYASVTCDEGCTPSTTAIGGPLTGETEQEVPAVEVTGLTAQRYWYRLVASNAEGTAQGAPLEFTPGAALPSIESESVSHVTPTDATLDAQINPHEAQAGDYYQFQLVKDPSEYASEILCPAEPSNIARPCIGTHSATALPIGWVCGSCEREAEAQQVQLDLASAGVTLQPGTNYHYRVIAARAVRTEDTIEWEPPTVFGSDQTFTTLPSGKAPVIDSESVSQITATDATLEAQINTEGLETSYQFQLESGCLPPLACAAITTYPLPSGLLLGSFLDQSVSLDLNSAGVTLSPGVEYAYSLTATNVAGSVTGPEQRFTTPEDGVPNSNTTTSAGPQSTTQAGENTDQGSVTPTALGLANQTSQSPKTTVSTRARKLAKALRACRHQPRKRRARCVRRGHRRYRAGAKSRAR
jgi:hypothetical protein